MEKIKYKIVRDGDGLIIIAEDGGVATTHHNGEHMLTTYYQNRIDENTTPENIWDELAEGKAYLKDWEEFTDLPTEEQENEMIQDALYWLVFHPDYDFEFVRDDSIWTSVF